MLMDIGQRQCSIIFNFIVLHVTAAIRRSNNEQAISAIPTTHVTIIIKYYTVELTRCSLKIHRLQQYFIIIKYKY